MTEPSVSQSDLWRQRLRRLSARARPAAPFISGIFAAFGALLLYNLLFPGSPPLTLQQVNDTVAQVLASATPPPPFSAQVYQVIRPSLILIQTESLTDTGDVDDGLGSGVVISQEGLILTSLHVVDGAASIVVTFADGTESTAEIMAADPEHDIAVLSAHQPPPQLFPATVGNPGALRVGDETFAVGHPFGLYASMSGGVISGFERSFQPPNGKQRLEGLIQFDAAVNPGNSGGPLLNRYGQVIGIVTGIVNPTEQDVFIGIGFAVPIDVAGGAADLPPY